MIPVKPIDPDDLPLYAMQLLEPEQMEELTLQLQHSVEARRILAELYNDLALVAHTAEEHTPTAIARQKLLKQVAREKKVVPPGPLDRFAPAHEDAIAPRLVKSSAHDEDHAPRSLGARVLPWLGWALAAGIGAFSFVEYQQTESLKHAVALKSAEVTRTTAQTRNAALALQTLQDPAAIRVTLTTAATRPQPTGRVTYVPETGSLILIAGNLEPLDVSKTYELWIIPADGRDPMPAGTFKPDDHGDASVVLPQIAKGVPAKAFGITIEDGEGSTTPTLPIILKGQPA